MSRSRAARRAIDNAHRLLADERRGDPAVPELTLDADRRAAGARGRPGDGRRLALRPRAGGARDQAGARRPDRGDLPGARLSHDAAALRLCASRSTPRAMAIERRISATFKDLPGGQVLGPTFDYTHRLLDSALADGDEPRRAPTRAGATPTRDAARHRPARRRGPDRARRRRDAGDAGRRPDARAAGRSRPTATCACRPGARRRGLPAGARLFDPARLRPQPSLRRRDPHRRGRGRVRVAEELGFAVAARPHHASPSARWSTSSRARRTTPPQFTRGYGLVFGQSRAQGDVDGAGRPRAARARARRGRRRRRRRTRSSCCRTPTTCRRPASSST